MSLNVNWMKHDVTKCDSEALRKSVPAEIKKELSPLRQKLKQKGEQVVQKRQLLTLSEIEAKIDEARLRWKTPNHGDIHTRFHIEDGKRFLDAMSTNERFDLTFMRHQNFWNNPKLWARMFEGGLRQLGKDGLFVITSYFDVEHKLACRKLEALGAVKVADHRNLDSRALADAPGKSVDRHIAVFRKPPSGTPG